MREGGSEGGREGGREGMHSLSLKGALETERWVIGSAVDQSECSFQKTSRSCLLATSVC